MAANPTRISGTHRQALIVDDSPIARYVLCGALENFGLEVATTDSAESALDYLADKKPDIVFMDHLLPNMHGIEAVRRLRSEPANADISVVMYTTQDSESFVRLSRIVGADDILLKTDKMSKLEQILGRSGMLTKRTHKPKSNTNVVSMTTNSDAPSLAELESRLEATIEKTLERNREQLRQDLLSEFAILERYEERMRRELVERIDAVANKTFKMVSSALDDNEQARLDRSRRTWRNIVYAAGFVLALAVGVLLGSLN